jgi:3-oxoacyl-[acyl-carrier protein] reductase
MSSNPVNLNGQTAIVTGAGRGIGRSIALTLAQAGVKTAVVSRTSEQVEETASLIREAGGEALAVSGDISDEQDVLRLFDTVGKNWGNLDILVNNAGIGRYAPVAEAKLEDIEAVLDVNLKGTFLCCREAMKLMIPEKSGYIINISSVVGFKGYTGQGAYTASKHGVMGLTKTLAAEAAEYGIRVSAVLPGGVDTEMVAHARPDLDRSILLQPEDVAQSVMYLLSLSDKAAVDQIYIRRRTSQPF